MQEPHMNIAAIAVAAVIPMIMGFLYYHPAALGKAWMKANGFTAESMGTGPKPILYLLALGVSFLFAMFLWNNVTGSGGVEQSQVIDPKDGHSFVTFGHGMAHGIIISLTIFLPVFTTMAIFERKSFLWAVVNWGYWALTTILMCGLLSAWR